MTSVNEFQNSLFNSSMNIFYSLSFYSPIIICVSIVVFSMFTGTMEKVGFFFLWIFVITFIRIIVFKGLFSSNEPLTKLPDVCLTGLTELFIPQDVTYSTYILTFTMMYFITPMIMVSKQNNINAVNYGVIAFFIAYIALDIIVKNTLSCVPGIVSKVVIGNVISGLSLGAVIAGLIMYGTNLKSYLYINEVNTNKEVCSMPSKQQFRCSVYKDGTLVGSSIN